MIITYVPVSDFMILHFVRHILTVLAVQDTHNVHSRTHTHSHIYLIGLSTCNDIAFAYSYFNFETIM
jgi:hypothetical protein